MKSRRGRRAWQTHWTVQQTDGDSTTSTAQSEERFVHVSSQFYNIFLERTLKRTLWFLDKVCIEYIDRLNELTDVPNEISAKQLQEKAALKCVR